MKQEIKIPLAHIIWCTKRVVQCDNSVHVPKELAEKPHWHWAIVHNDKLAIFVKKPYIYYNENLKRWNVRLRIPSDVIEYLGIKRGDVVKLYAIEVIEK